MEAPLLFLLFLPLAASADDCLTRLDKISENKSAPVQTILQLTKNLPRACPHANCQSVAQGACNEAVELHRIYHTEEVKRALDVVYLRTQVTNMKTAEARYKAAEEGFSRIDEALGSVIRFLERAEKSVGDDGAQKLVRITRETLQDQKGYNKERLVEAQKNRLELGGSSRNMASMGGGAAAQDIAQKVSAVPGLNPSDLPQAQKGMGEVLQSLDALNANAGPGEARAFVESVRTLCGNQEGAIKQKMAGDCRELGNSKYTCSGLSYVSESCHLGAIRQAVKTTKVPFMLATGSSRLRAFEERGEAAARKVAQEVRRLRRLGAVAKKGGYVAVTGVAARAVPLPAAAFSRTPAGAENSKKSNSLAGALGASPEALISGSAHLGSVHLGAMPAIERRPTSESRAGNDPYVADAQPSRSETDEGDLFSRVRGCHQRALGRGWLR